MCAKVIHHRARRVALIGVPMEEGASQRGTSQGPAALRRAGLASKFEREDLIVVDRGDVVSLPSPRVVRLPGHVRNAAAVARWAQAVAREAHGLARQFDFAVFLGGDHAISIGTLAGISRYCAEQRRQLFVLWLDAHPDFNTPLTTPSGNLHGMALAAMTGERTLAPLLEGTGHVPIEPRNVLLLGTRAVDRAEAEMLAAKGVRVCGVHRLRSREGLQPLQTFLGRVADCVGHLHVSFDIDVLDPSLAPGVGTPANGGPTYEEAALCRR
jgi:arginase